MKERITKSKGNVFVDLGFPPEEATVLAMRADLMAKLRKLTDAGAEFASHIDGSKHVLTPERVIDIQRTLGSDIMMTFDECVHYPAARDYVEQSLALTMKWAKRSKKYLETQGRRGGLNLPYDD